MSRVAFIKLGRRRLQVKVAVSFQEQTTGLQGHEDLRLGHGMLFPFSPPRPARFHMGKVAFPIDVIFVGTNNRISRIIHNAQPGTEAQWSSYGVCSAVVEVPGGFCRHSSININDEFVVDANNIGVERQRSVFDIGAALEGYSAPVDKVEPGDHGPMDGDSRFQDRDTPDKASPNAIEGTMPHWEQQIGYDPTTEEHRTENAPALYRMSGGLKTPALQHIAQGIEGAELPSGEIVDPVAFALGAIKMLAEAARKGDSLTWKPDVLTGGQEEYAYVTADTVKKWLSHIGVADVPAVVSAATSASGLETISEAMILSEVATRTRFSPDGNVLILYRDAEDNGERQAQLKRFVAPMALGLGLGMAQPSSADAKPKHQPQHHQTQQTQRSPQQVSKVTPQQAYARGMEVRPKAPGSPNWEEFEDAFPGSTDAESKAQFTQGSMARLLQTQNEAKDAPTADGKVRYKDNSVLARIFDSMWRRYHK